jgi:hypothetical protein
MKLGTDQYVTLNQTQPTLTTLKLFRMAVAMGVVLVEAM